MLPVNLSTAYQAEGIPVEKLTLKGEARYVGAFAVLFREPPDRR